MRCPRTRPPGSPLSPGSRAAALRPPRPRRRPRPRAGRALAPLRPIGPAGPRPPVEHPARCGLRLDSWIVFLGDLAAGDQVLGRRRRPGRSADERDASRSTMLGDGRRRRMYFIDALPVIRFSATGRNLRRCAHAAVKSAARRPVHSARLDSARRRAARIGMSRDETANRSAGSRTRRGRSAGRRGGATGGRQLSSRDGRTGAPRSIIWRASQRRSVTGARRRRPATTSAATMSSAAARVANDIYPRPGDDVHGGPRPRRRRSSAAAPALVRVTARQQSQRRAPATTTTFATDVEEIYGGAGEQRLIGDLAAHAAAEIIWGGDGNNTIVGGSGPNRIYGGPGTDTDRCVQRPEATSSSAGPARAL